MGVTVFWTGSEGHYSFTLQLEELWYFSDVHYVFDIRKLESNYKTVSRAEDFLSLCVIIIEDSTNATKSNTTVWSLMFAAYHIYMWVM